MSYGARAASLPAVSAAVPTLGELVALTGAVVLGYYLLVNAAYLAVHLSALLELQRSLRRREWGPMYQPFSSPFPPGVSVVVPAYNESEVIVESVQSLLNLNYPDVEVLVVNDGSTDDTLDRLREGYDLEPVEADPPVEMPCQPVRGVYRSADVADLTVIDKDNGGKSDALNAGVWLTDQPLFCAVDADTVIDQEALLKVVRPFLERPEATVATGGTVRVANDCTVENGVVESVDLPGNRLARVQVMEYLRAFYSGRLGLTRLQGLMIISGAFGVFRTDVVREVGGYDTDSITEDFELVVRLHRYLSERDREYRVEFVPEPAAWTEVPEDQRVLSRQRRRWYRGLVDTLFTHRRMLFNPEYGRAGLFGMPLFVFVEAIGPLVEGAGYVVVPVAFLLGIVNVEYTATYFAVALGVGLLLSWFGIMSEAWGFRRYDSPRQVVRLLWAGVVENAGYRQLRTAYAWHGFVEWIRGQDSWGEITRSGFDEDDPPSGDDRAVDSTDDPGATASTDDPDGSAEAAVTETEDVGDRPDAATETEDAGTDPEG